MSRAPRLIQILSRPSELSADSGAALIEFALVLPVFLLLLFGLIDFGRLGFSIVMSRSAVDLAVRTATVRPSACNSPPAIPLPTYNGRGTDTTPPFGTSCSSAAGICSDPGTITCTGNPTNLTAAEIWAKVAPLMPFGTTIQNLSFTYSYDPNLGFLGGPYVPMVTVALTGAKFHFISPLGALAQIYGGTLGFSTANGIDFPTISASLPGEDLAEGNGG